MHVDPNGDMLQSEDLSGAETKFMPFVENSEVVEMPYREPEEAAAEQLVPEHPPAESMNPECQAEFDKLFEEIKADVPDGEAATGSGLQTTDPPQAADTVTPQTVETAETVVKPDTNFVTMPDDSPVMPVAMMDRVLWNKLVCEATRQRQEGEHHHAQDSVFHQLWTSSGDHNFVAIEIGDLHRLPTWL